MPKEWVSRSVDAQEKTLRRIAVALVAAAAVMGTLVPTAAATDVLNSQQLIKGGNANSFNRNYGRSVIENVNNFGGAPSEPGAPSAPEPPSAGAQQPVAPQPVQPAEPPKFNKSRFAI